ncbi:MAG: hypothetical protein ACKOPE_03370 [Novosphingobium sp.]
MTKPHSTRLLETDFDEYLELRINQLGLHATVADIRTSAFEFQKQIGLVHNQANALLALGIITLFAIGHKFAIAPTGKLIDILLDLIWIVPGCAIAFGLLFYGFRRQSWNHYLGLGRMRPLRCTAQPIIDEVLDEVDAGHHTIMRIADSGTGTTASPISHRPVELVLGKGCLASPWLAAKLFGGENAKRQFVVVTPEATGEWFNYFLWNAPVADHLLDLFDRTPEIYAGERMKRTKARIALREIAAFVAAQKSSAKPALRKDVVVSAFEKALKIEAARLRAANEIDDLEERQLCRLNITGEAASTDPAETSGNRGRKPESWFLNLMSGQYTPVTRPLAATVRNELNLSPGFVA